MHPAPSLDEQVHGRISAWQKAFVSKDVDSIMAFYAQGEFTAFDLMPPFEFSGGAMWRRNWEEFYAAFDGPIGLDVTNLLVYAQVDLAVARFAARLSGTMYGQPLDSWVRTTICFRRIDGQWLMIHDHVSWPIDFATGKALMDLAPARPAG
jgi:ketosteroid isomerase-like protein